MIPAQLVESAAIDLRRLGMLRLLSETAGARFRYCAGSAVDGTIAKLAQQYAENPARVARGLNTNAIERVRTSALTTFADAFVLKKKDQDRG